MTNAVLDKNIKINSAFAKGKGRVFGSWMTSGRATGYLQSNLIENPIYMIESLFRDEIFTERDLIIDSVSTAGVGSYYVKIDGSINNTPLNNTTNDYYLGATFHNNSTVTIGNISGYVGSTKTLTVSLGTAPTAGDKVSISNIQGDARINEASFDKLGNTTNGLRNGWKFRASFLTKRSTKDILKQILFECHCILFDTYSGIKIIALDAETAPVDTWTTPLTENSAREMVFPKLSSLADIYTDFRLKYAYDYGRGDYMKEYFVNPDGYTSGASLSVEKTLCINAKKNHKIPRREYEYNSDFIYDDTTAQNLLKKLVAFKTSQKLIVNWSGEISTHIKYEKGDQVKLNYSKMIPTGLNNSSLFMIISKTIQPKKKVDMQLSTF